jgi:outer membrane lipoprotein-sorting protein
MVLLAVLPSTSALAAQEPSAEEVIGKFIEATGGKDAYAKLTSRVSTGKITIADAGLTGPIVIYQKAPNLIRVTGNVGAVTFDRGFDGQVAYENHSMLGTRLIEGEERELMEEQSLFSPLLDLSRFYTRVDNRGAEPIDGRDAWKIELTMKSGQVITQWFDTESGLMVQMQMAVDSPAGKLEITSTTADWKDVTGVKVPFKTKQLIEPLKIEQTIEFTKIESNVAIPPEQFDPPEEVKDLIKEANQPATQPAGGGK